MKTIYKYPLQVDDVQMVRMPQGATILDVQVQHGQPCVWALVDPARPLQDRVFCMFGTGHEVPTEDVVLVHLSTIQLSGGGLVFHVFEQMP